MTAAGEAVLSFAYGEVGTQSGDKYWAWYGADLGSYCACFVSYCAEHAGYPVCPIDSSKGFVLVSNGTVHSYENGEAKPTLDLQPGDIILFSWYYWEWQNGIPVITEDPWVGWIAGDHTGYFSHWIDQGSGRFATVEGNTSGGVVAYREDRYTSQVCGWWRTPATEGAWPPEPEPEPEPPKPKDDAMIIRDTATGEMYVVSDMGKRYIGGHEAEAWTRIGTPVVDLNSVQISSIPNAIPVALIRDSRTGACYQVGEAGKRGVGGSEFNWYWGRSDVNLLNNDAMVDEIRDAP